MEGNVDVWIHIKLGEGEGVYKCIAVLLCYLVL